MSGDRSFLKNAANAPQTETKIIDPQVARQLPVVFGFKHLNLHRDPFDCTPKHGQSLIDVLKMITLFSGITIIQIDMSYKNCHVISEDQIKKHGLESTREKAPTKRLHQLGKKQTPERVIGFYDSPLLNLFQICFLDLNHSLSGD